MDKGEGVPEGLREETEDSIRESLALLEEWHESEGGRLRYCFAPRFAVSCTEPLLRRVGSLARERGVLVHTHASENRDEIQIVERETGRRNVEYLQEVGLTGSHVVLAHCVHVTEGEMNLLARTGTHVAHCPSSNMKLGSGVAPVTEMLERGVSVSLGADGAPCNNRLDMFTEMRGAALLQKVRHGASVLPARAVLRMATIEGARALGLEREVGTLETGKRADITVLDLSRLHLTPRPDAVSTIVYAAEAADVRTVIVDGKILLEDGELKTLDARGVIEDAREQFGQLASRAGI